MIFQQIYLFLFFLSLRNGVFFFFSFNRTITARTLEHFCFFFSLFFFSELANHNHASVRDYGQDIFSAFFPRFIAFDEGERCLFMWFLPAGLIMSRGYRSRCQSISGFGRHLGLEHLASIPFGLAHVASIPCVT